MSDVVRATYGTPFGRVYLVGPDNLNGFESFEQVVKVCSFCQREGLPLPREFPVTAAILAEVSSRATYPLSPREVAALDGSGGPRVVERPPTGAELLKPIPPNPTIADFPTEDAWKAYKADAERLHYEERIAAAREAWFRAHEFSQTRDCPEDDRLLEWHFGTAKQDGAANATALREWHAAHPGYDGPPPSDAVLVAWLRERREKQNAFDG